VKLTTEPVEVVDQPLNVYPALVGEVGAVNFASVATDPAVTEDPPCSSKVTIRVFTDQIAYKVKLEVCPCVYPPVKLTTEPVEVVDQPLNVYPALVGAVGAVNFASVATDPAVTDDPPCESKVTVRVSTAHIA
jgi:hypothetical protein